MKLFKIISLFVETIREKIELMGYNEYTIEKYFQKRGYRVGNGNRIYIKKIAGEPYLVKIGNHCTITAGVIFLTHDGGAWVFREGNQDLNVFGKIEVKDNCFIGVSSIILPNVTIGPNSVVGAGSVVTRDVPPNVVVAGVPAKVISTIDEYEKKCVGRWRALGLKGTRSTWEKQLIDNFWGDKE